MVRLTRKERADVAETVRELANYGAAALVFGQFVGERAVSWRPVAWGIVLWLGFVGAALYIERD